MDLPADRMQSYLSASAEAEAERRHHHRPGTEPDGRGRALERADRQIDVVPLAFLRAQQKLHQVGAYRKVAAVARDHESFELTNSLAVGTKRLGDHADNIFPDGVL